MARITEKENKESINDDTGPLSEREEHDDPLRACSPPVNPTVSLSGRRKRSIPPLFSVFEKAFSIFAHSGDNTAPAPLSDPKLDNAEPITPNPSSAAAAASPLSVATPVDAQDDSLRTTLPRTQRTARAPQSEDSTPPASGLSSEEAVSNAPLHTVSPTLFKRDEISPELSTDPKETIKIKILLTPFSEEKMGLHTILRSVSDTPEDLALQTGKVVHSRVPRGEDSILKFLKQSKALSDTFTINLESPPTPTKEDPEDIPMMIIKTISDEDIQTMRQEQVKIASFITQAIAAAEPVLAHVSTIAVLVYTSKAKLAQFYAKFGQAAGSALPDASLTAVPSARDITPPRDAPAAPGVVNSPSQDSEFTLGSDSDDGLGFVVAAGIGASAASVAAARAVARGEEGFAAAMEAGFEALIDDVVVLAAAAA
ncbi:hypothetical protein Sant_2597 [Sodalis praecaptivus]|uniref:Uncharacterized protein n=1 Tax=Sodalis praecaptivus TaxID=1239307 RepID=W0HZI7_9GAMM|nr:hypothetical protein [Sodalis praecaptivus]AHF77625.1 hypothetical protein Sant_2597 [Sodalis praecaptivus]